MPKKNIEKVVDAALDQVLEIDGRLMMDVVSVATALGALREALDKVDESLDKREFEKASSLGYNAVSSEFIFLQRTLGALQDSQYAKESLISEIALKSGSGIYEEVEPFVSKRMQSAREHKSELTKEQWRQVADMFRAGKSKVNVAQAFGVSEDVVAGFEGLFAKLRKHSIRSNDKS